MTNLKNHLAILLVAFSFVSLAQDQLSHSKQKYVSEDGKLYWPSEMPVYMFISANPEGKGKERLKSSNSPEYADPFYLDTEGVNYIRTRWAVDPETKQVVQPQQEIMFEIYRDGIAPDVSLAFESELKYNNGKIQYYGSDLSVVASATDASSGIQVIHYSENGTAYLTYSNAMKFDKDGEYEYKVYAVDNVGNVEEPETYKFAVDLESPVSNHDLIGSFSENILSPRTKIGLLVTDEKSGVRNSYYSLDGGEEKRYYAPIKINLLEEGTHSISYYSIDRVGNQESKKTFEFFLDKTRPEIVATIEGDQFENETNLFVSSRTKLKLESTDNKAGISHMSYKIGSRAEEKYAGPFNIPTNNGKYFVKFFATDKVDNNYVSLSDPSGLSQKVVTMDNNAPTLSKTYSGSKYFARDTMFVTGETMISLSAGDNASGLKELVYRVNDGEFAPFTEGFNLGDEGTYVIEYKASDNVANEAIESFAVIVDNNGPVVENILSSEPVGSIALNDKSEDLHVHSKGVKLYLGATDKVVDTEAVYYSINNGPEKKYSTPITLNQTGIVTYKVRAIDKLGNETNSEINEIFVK